MRMAGPPPFARMLSMDITMDTTLSACKVLRPCYPTRYVMGSTDTPRDTAWAPRGLLGGALHVTSAASQFLGPAMANHSTTTPLTWKIFGVDNLLVTQDERSAGVSRVSARFHVATLLSSWMELCNNLHPQEHAESTFNSRSTTSTTIFSCLIIVLVFLGTLAVKVSARKSYVASVVMLNSEIERASARKMRIYDYVNWARICGAIASIAEMCHIIFFFVLRKAMSFNKKQSYILIKLPTQVVILVILFNIKGAQAVCTTCRGAVDGCAGGSTCPWLTTVATNAAAVVATATTGLICAKSLLPPGLLQAFPRSALDTILLLARLPAAGTPFSLTSTTTVAELRMAYRQGRISKSDVAEGISMLVANVGTDSADLTKLQMQIKTIELELSEPEPQSRTDIGGVYVYIMAKISQFVLRSQAPVWARSVQEKAGATMAAALHFPAAEIADAAVPMMVELFVLFVHAFGLDHLHTVGPFAHRVVHESVWMHDYTWLYAFELLIVYLKVLDERRANVSMSSIWESGSQDTFAKNAEKAARQRWGANFVFFRAHGGNPGKQPAQTGLAAAKDPSASKVKWNGKFTKGAKPCLTFNNGRDNHPRACLLPDGTCKFDHVCDHFLVGGQKCLAADHGRHACTNPDKSERRQQ